MNTPSGILAAFTSDSPLTLTMEGVLLMEAESPSLLTGGNPTYRDLLVASLILSDAAAFGTARRAGTLKDYLKEQSSRMTPRELMGLMPKITDALKEAFAPTEGAEGAGEKKPEPAAAGG